MSRSSRRTSKDHGYAWVILASCSLMRMLIDGFWSSFGIIFLKWQEQFNVSATKTSWIGSTFMLSLFAAAPISSALSHRLSHRVLVLGAGINVFVGCFALSLVTQFWHIYTIMPLMSFGLGLSYQASFTSFLPYFDKHFALANTLNSVSTGMGFFTIPPLIEILISNYGLAGTFQITSAILANMCVCGSLLRPSKFERLQTKECKLNFKPEKSTDICTENYTKKRNQCGFLKDVAKDFDLSLFGNVRFLFQAVCNGLLYGGISSSIIFFVPCAIHGGISERTSSFLMVVFGICCITARLSPTAWLVDNNIVSASTLSGIAHLVCGIMIIAIPFTGTFPALLMEAAVFGLSLGVGGSLIIVVIACCGGSKDKAPGAIAWYFLQYGVGCLICLLLVGFLYDETGNYQLSMTMCGLCAICIGVIVLADPCLIRWQSRLDEKRKRRSTCSEHVVYTSFADGAIPTQV